MKEWSPREIRALAYEKILTPLWRRRRELALGVEPSPLELLPMPCERIITLLVNLKLEEPEEIIPDRGPHPKAGYQIAGVLDRELGRIVSARKFPLPCRRFTMLHELGHYFLHPDLLYHRDAPLIGSERTEVRGRTREEVEADTFAAEVLMPPLLTANLFLAKYGSVISPDEIDEHLAFRLSTAAMQTISVDMLVDGSRRDRSRLIAVEGHGHAGRSFVELFGASKEAMAIRLEELGLVL